jgi:hypothetical protein
MNLTLLFVVSDFERSFRIGMHSSFVTEYFTSKL